MLNFMIALMLCGAVSPQNQKPMTETKKVVVYAPMHENKPQVIVPSGSMHGQMIAYENMQRRINNLELRKEREFRNMMNELTPQYSIVYSGRQPYYGGFYNDGQSGLRCPSHYR